MPAMGSEVQRILVVLPTWVGDAVMATPALRAVRQRFPEAHIAWTGPPAARLVLAGSPWVDEVLPDPSKGGGLRGLLKARRMLRRGRFDLAVMLSNAFRVALLCRLGGIPRRVGYDRDKRGWLLTDRAPVPTAADGSFEPTPAIRYYLDLTECLGCDVVDRTMTLSVEDTFAAEADDLFAQVGIDAHRPVVVVNPGASFGSSKLWQPERFAAVADTLIERRGAQILINVAPKETAIAAAVVGAMRHTPAVDFGKRGNTLGLLKAVIARANLLITGDTGPRHVAAALGTPVVTLFGPTDPDWTTIDFPDERIVRVDVPCAPCQKKLCPLPVGPRHHLCMERITPEMVLVAAEQLLPPANREATT